MRWIITKKSPNRDRGEKVKRKVIKQLKRNKNKKHVAITAPDENSSETTSVTYYTNTQEKRT